LPNQQKRGVGKKFDRKEKLSSLRNLSKRGRQSPDLIWRWRGETEEKRNAPGGGRKEGAPI